MLYRLIKLELVSVFIQLFVSDSLAWMNWMKFRVPLALCHISERGDAEKDVVCVCVCVCVSFCHVYSACSTRVLQLLLDHAVLFSV